MDIHLIQKVKYGLSGMKKLIVFLISCYSLVGCVNNQTKTKTKELTYLESSSPFALSVKRELHYKDDKTIDTSLFGLKQAFIAQEGDFNRSKNLAVSPTVHSILSRGFTLIGTPYRYGGQSVKTGFDCSGFVSYLYSKEAGIHLPRSTRQMIRMKAPKVTKAKLKPGDVLFFATGRGRQVSHIGIYIGNQYFIHSANQRKGVRIDSLSNRYWNVSFIEAKRILD